jgi:hypothetical protein
MASQQSEAGIDNICKDQIVKILDIVEHLISVTMI